jgi:hypothetical protein
MHIMGDSSTGLLCCSATYETDSDVDGVVLLRDDGASVIAFSTVGFGI